jgi:uncharacterized membrane protein YdbT with pleckstrin-like domain
VAFPRKLLNDREEIVVDQRPHWRFLLRPAVVLAVAVAALVAAATLDLHEWAQLGLAAVTLGALVWFAGRYARWATTSFVVTTDRLIHRSGVLAKRGMEIPLEQVNTVFFEQSVLERLLRCGDLVIESGGERGSQAFSDISTPSLVQNEIYRQIEANQGRMSAGRAPVTESIGEKLQQLDELRRRGVVTQAEFDAKKATLLDRL